MEFVTKDALKTVSVKAFTLANNDTGFVRVFSGKARDEWNAVVKNAKEADAGEVEYLYCPLLVRTLCNAQGERLLTNDDAAWLAENADSKVLAELFDVAVAWNRLGKDAEEETKKASPVSADSGSPSPAI